ncbi:ArsR/SmtB family transcription factor [Myceligenerans xiligouense]|uniref:ArsR family transcriptional regulator n=1 Tax=Myceligenerans xiligouense TaxID=253184 RepID=A0A3N4YRP0_9MICO|nr:metalloregulator ArsR/SmtB family transcription factor [Myceligenerans xiligouense]RPF22226.1 ArsR family transcriptional regulator [Myceligenerans xiligouense]
MDTQPLYQIKADLFKALGHPTRIQVLEVLAAASDHTAPVARLADVTRAEASQLSQHLAVLKRAGVVTSTRTGNAVRYQLAEPLVAELLVVARAFLLSSLATGRDGAADRLTAARDLPALPGANARTLLAATRPGADDDTPARA